GAVADGAVGTGGAVGDRRILAAGDGVAGVGRARVVVIAGAAAEGAATAVRDRPAVLSLLRTRGRRARHDCGSREVALGCERQLLPAERHGFRRFGRISTLIRVSEREVYPGYDLRTS